jgi:(S)-sulfolactate dehydrogenase
MKNTPDVIVTEFMDSRHVDPLRAGYAVHHDAELWNKPEELRRLAGDAIALVVRNRTPVDAALLAAAPKLKAVGRLGVGLDNIDVPAYEARGVEVISARGANATSVSEYAVTMAMALLRGRAYYGTERLIAGEWPRQEFGSGLELAGKTLGIIGLGSIGSTLARKMRALDMRVIATDPYLADTNENWNLAEKVSLDTLLATSHVVTLHCPLNDETRGMIGAKEIARMRPGAMLINAARGGMVDHRALAAALKDGRLGGAAIDVFPVEPIVTEEALTFAGVPNVILTPHISGVTRESNHRVSTMTVEGVLRVLKKAR